MRDTHENEPARRIGLPSGKAALLVAINMIATSILFFLTVDDNEPLIAPISEVSMILRWIVIAAIIAFLQSMWMLGKRRAERERED